MLGIHNIEQALQGGCFLGVAGAVNRVKQHHLFRIRVNKMGQLSGSRTYSAAAAVVLVVKGMHRPTIRRMRTWTEGRIVGAT